MFLNLISSLSFSAHTIFWPKYQNHNTDICTWNTKHKKANSIVGRSKVKKTWKYQKKITKMLRILKIRKKFVLFFLLYYSIKRNEENAREMTSNFYDWLIFYFPNIWEPEDKKNRNLDSYFVISATYINPESYEVVLMLICSEQFQD